MWPQREADETPLLSATLGLSPQGRPPSKKVLNKMNKSPPAAAALNGEATEHTHTHTRARNQNDFIAVQSQISSGFYSLRLIQKYMSLHRILSANRPVWFCG